MRPKPIGRSVLLNLAKIGWPATLANGADVADIDVRPALADLKDFLAGAIDALRSAPDIEAIAPCPVEFCRDEFTEFASRTGIRKLILMSRRWHDLYACAIRAIAKARGSESGAEAAIALLEEPMRIGDLSIVQLRTESDFFVESAEMGHCVASLFDSALAGRAVYFSVRNEAGFCVSTFDLTIRRAIGAHQVVLNEHRGPRNCRPVPEALAAVREFCRRLSERDVAEAVARYLENIESTMAGQIDNDFVDEADPVEGVEHEARRSAARVVLWRPLPKMVRNVLRKCEHNDSPGC